VKEMEVAELPLSHHGVAMSHRSHQGDGLRPPPMGWGWLESHSLHFTLFLLLHFFLSFFNYYFGFFKKKNEGYYRNDDRKGKSGHVRST
jgi:hypothetical protein